MPRTTRNRGPAGHAPIGSEPSAPRAGSKVDAIVKHCVFEISTGAWSPGARLPSVRRAAAEWAVNHLTVLKAYRRLVELRLARNVERSGFFVLDDVAPRVDSPVQVALTELFDEMVLRVDALPGAVPRLAAFQFFADLAAVRARAAPEVAFAECTMFQARGHAREVSARLGLPCLALCTRELDAVPAHVRTVVTTGFHTAEVESVAGQAAVLTVPIEFSNALAHRLAAAAREVVFFQTDGDIAAHVARDAMQCKAGFRAVAAAGASTDEIEAATRRVLRAKTRAVVLSPTLWGAIPVELQRHPRVFALATEISAGAWPTLERQLAFPAVAER